MSLVQSSNNVDILHDIKKYPVNTLHFAFGELGKKILDFSNAVDISHPGLLDISLSKYSQIMCQILKVTQYSLDNNFNLFLENFSKNNTKDLSKELKLIDDPKRNQQHIRFLNKKDRDEVRSKKEKFNLESSAFYNKAKKFWRSYPNNFNLYTRNNQKYKDEIQNGFSKANNLRSMGYEELAVVIENYTNLLKSSFIYDYHGFHRITITDAAIILAKMHGFSLHKDLRGNNSIVVKNKNNCFKYKASVYPLYYFGKIPDFVSKFINYLENFPSCNHKSIFDHYFILSPSLGDEIALRNQVENNFLEIENKEDFFLIENNLVTPIVLGEKDGICHFICDWSLERFKNEYRN